METSGQIKKYFYRYFLKPFYILSILTGTYWISGVFITYVLNVQESNFLNMLLISLSVFVALATYVFPLYSNRSFLELDTSEAIDTVILKFLFSSAGGYLLLMPVFWSIGYYIFFNNLDPSVSDFATGERQTGAALSAIWLSLFFAPSVGAFWTWWTLGRKIQ